MAYTKQTWQTGEVITANKLNHMEDGIASSGGGGGVLVVNAVVGDSEVTLDKTWQEIYDAPFAVMKFTRGGAVSLDALTSIFYDELTHYTLYFGESTPGSEFTTDTADGYPSTTMG